MRVGIVGCGLIGQKRAKALAGAHLTMCADVVMDRAAALAKTAKAEATDDWQKLVTSPHVDVVVVATRHDVLAPITRAAIDNGKHVLVEKPAARHTTELAGLADAAK
ncbi:MAG: gfo/Idh/MocA family oxidoreductase, partial [Alphaproteobacteria bacterium]|nr:gfo/Idh/MocA family oxidoreductase [Alphaproteobacteria bacterium]